MSAFYIVQHTNTYCDESHFVRYARIFDDATDGNGALTMLPLAALLTGSVLMAGVVVLLVVVVAVRRKADPQSRSGSGTCGGGHLGGIGGGIGGGLGGGIGCGADDKAKHLGMDMTVTAPLDMGAGGQQRFVVAYTLKSGVEKQPDILSAQKSRFDAKWGVAISANAFRVFFCPVDANESVHIIDDSATATTSSGGGGSNSSASGAGKDVDAHSSVSRPDALYLPKSSYTTANYVS